jgi:hypothetical protein
MATTDPRLLGDLGIARLMLAHDDFLEGHVGTDAEEVMGDAPASEPGVVSVHLNGDVVDALLAASGWTILADDRGTRAFVAPDGDRVWNVDEALTIALTAEVV